MPPLHLSVPHIQQRHPGDRFIYLNDPAFPTVPLQVTQGDFDLAWLEWDESYVVVTPE